MPRAINERVLRLVTGRERLHQTRNTARPNPVDPVIPEELAKQVGGTGHLITRVDLYDHKGQNHLLTTSPFGSAPRVKMVGGEIVTSDSSDIQGSGTLNIIADRETAEAVLPLVTRAPLSPIASTRLHVRFHAPGDDEEFCQYGVYEIKDATIDYTEGGVVLAAEIADNSRRVQRARFYRFDAVFPKTAYSVGFHHLLDDILPDSEIRVASTTARTGLLTFDIQSDRLAAVKEMATAIGFRIDWNGDGLANTDIYPDVDGEDVEEITPYWEFVDGGNARVVGVRRNLTDERSYNGVIAMGESTGSDKPPARGEAWDTNPSSPTYFDPTKPDQSPYGPVPFFYVSEFITTNIQARHAARVRLPKVKGLVEVLELSCIPHPGVVPGDPILVVRPEIGVEGIYVVETVRMPLTAGRMTVTCRDRRMG